VGRRYVSLDPTDPALEQRFGAALQKRLREFFLLKAHGSVGSGAGLVLTVEEYRDLLAKNPSFRAFVQNLFTNFNFLMVGYGLDDPDFDLFLRTMGEQFAGPLQEHIVLRRIDQRHRREEVEQRLYGIRTLHLNDFGEIPEALRQAARTAGPRLRETLDRCLASAHEERRRGTGS
jgi:SIR2-like domain